MVAKLPTFECLRCGHQWNPRSNEKPKRCAFCKSPYWDKASDKTSPSQGQHEQACMGCRDKK